ncbi:MAG TPA: hypothetical protein VM346_01185 [Sphingomicrobium sp.]|nr:hypothetical protein [Sphingomicrobium sp.]
MGASTIVQAFALFTAVAAMFAASGWYRVMGRGSAERIQSAAVPTSGAFLLLAITMAVWALT